MERDLVAETKRNKYKWYLKDAKILSVEIGNVEVFHSKNIFFGSAQHNLILM